MGTSTNLEKPIAPGAAPQLGAGAMRDDVDTDKREVVTFYDATDDMQQTGSITKLPIASIGDIHSDIYQFLRRPVKIGYFQWTTAGLNVNLDPWALVLGDVAVSRKLANFHLLRTGGLKIRIVSNGSPYQYGRYFIAYWPFVTTDYTATNTALSNPTRISTLPCFCTIDPSANSVVDFHIPEHYEFTRTITTAVALGSIVGTQAALLNTVSTVTPYCDITFYAEMIDPKIMFNTTQVPAYATSKEFKGAVSAPLHKLSQVAHKLSHVPVIGEYATAVGMASKFGANVAAMLGYSKPVDVASSVASRMVMVGNTVNAEGLDPSTVLALTKTAGTSIDPSTVGLPPQDEMTISSIIARPSLAQVITWNDTAVVADAIATVTHGPGLLPSYTYPVALTNLAYVHGLFELWRGSINYRFVFCVSKFHTGRVQIVYEPNTLNTSLDPTNVSLNWIVDIAQQQEIEICVPYAETSDFKYSSGVNQLGTTANIGNVGNLYFKVLNPLRCGSAVTSINILVYNAGGPDFEFGKPTALRLRNTTTMISWQPVAAEGAAPPATAYANWATSETLDDAALSTNMLGERIVSLRTLMKRYAYERYVSLTETSGDLSYNGIRAFPNSTGYCAKVGGVVRFNNAPMSHFTYLAPAYTSWKGGIRKKLVQSGLTYAPNSVVMYATNGVKYTDYGSEVATANTAQAFMAGWADGLHLVPRPLYDGPHVMEFTIPYTSNRRFLRNSATVTDYDSGTGALVIRRGAATTSQSYELFIAAADDFTFFYYIGAPMAHQITFA